MTDKIAAIVRFAFIPGEEERVAGIVERTLAVTRTFDGLERIDVLRSPERPEEWTLYEVWSDAQSEQAYRDFRATPEGADPDLASIVAGPPSLERFILRE